ncbi:MAG: tetratricopeptide repeat protein [Dechloromonas sp.]|nr:MAG: tetratricopeptide repeat protein [Dechloromonas sp.]
MLGRNEESLVSHEQAIALEPTFAQAHLNCGVVLRNLGRDHEAMACFNRAIAIRPTIRMPISEGTC